MQFPRRTNCKINLSQASVVLFDQTKGTVNFTKSYIKTINLKPYTHLRALYTPGPYVDLYHHFKCNLDFIITPICLMKKEYLYKLKKKCYFVWK